MAIHPGEYSIEDLIQALPFSRRTIERKLPYWSVETRREGNKRLFIVTAQNVKKIDGDIAKYAKRNVSDIVKDDVGTIEHLKSELIERDLLIAKMTGQLEKNEALALMTEHSNRLLLQAKDSEIDTLKVALASVEKTIQNLQASMLILERENHRLNEKANPSIPMIQADLPPVAFWKSLKNLLGMA